MTNSISKATILGLAIFGALISTTGFAENMGDGDNPAAFFRQYGGQSGREGVRPRQRAVRGRAVAPQAQDCFFCPQTPEPPAPVARGGRQRGGGRRCPALEGQIAQYVSSASDVACYSSLFNVESTCRVNVTHNRRATGNPHAGHGLCALETSPAIRAQNNRGPNCSDVHSTGGQIRCCVHLMRSTGGRYFGTVLSGKTPRCH